MQAMTQEERAEYLIRYLLNETYEYKNIAIPGDMTDKRRPLRSLMNMRPPLPAGEDFLKVAGCVSERTAQGKRHYKDRRSSADTAGTVSVAERYYHPGGRCRGKCGKQPDAGMLCSLSWVH